MSKQKICAAQKKKLLDFMGNRPLLRAGKFTQNFTHKHAQKEWEEVTRLLNSMPGAHKEWKAWRKTWQDILSKTKAKTASINRIRRGTGGGPPPPNSLDEFEEGVAALIHPHSISGHTESVESCVIFEDVVPLRGDSFLTIDIPPPIEISGLQSPPPINVSDAVILPPPSEFVNASNDSAAASVMPPPDVELPPPTNDKQKKKKKVNLKTLLQEKMKIKKESLEEKKNFYAAYISNMERQTAALEDISRAFVNFSNRQ